VSTSGCALASKRIHDNLDSFTEISQDTDIDAKINKPDLSDSSNSDDSWARENVGNDGGGDNEEDDNEDLAARDKMTMSFVGHHFIPHLVTNHFENDKYLFLHTIFCCYFFVQLHSKK
jgi:hypothetical protein